MSVPCGTMTLGESLVDQIENVAPAGSFLRKRDGGGNDIGVVGVPHRQAAVEEEGDVQRTRIELGPGDRPLGPALRDDEFLGLEIEDGMPFLVEHDG